MISLFSFPVSMRFIVGVDHAKVEDPAPGPPPVGASLGTVDIPTHKVSPVVKVYKVKVEGPAQGPPLGGIRLYTIYLPTQKVSQVVNPKYRGLMYGEDWKR